MNQQVGQPPSNYEDLNAKRKAVYDARIKLAQQGKFKKGVTAGFTKVFGDYGELYGKITTEELQQKIQKDALKFIGVIKVTLLIFLVLVSVTYFVFYHGNKEDVNLLGAGKHGWTIGGTSIFMGLFGVLSVIAVEYLRQGTKPFAGGKFKIYVLIFVILTMFELVKEASGFNRWLSADDIKDGVGPYVAVDEISDKKFEEQEEGGDPFIESSAYSLFGMMGIAGIWILLRFGYMAFYGAKLFTPQYAKTIPFIGAWGTFALVELPIMVLINSLSAFFATWMRGDKFTAFTFSTPLMVMVAHLIFQMVGMMGTGKQVSIDESIADWKSIAIFLAVVGALGAGMCALGGKFPAGKGSNNGDKKEKQDEDEDEDEDEK